MDSLQQVHRRKPSKDEAEIVPPSIVEPKAADGPSSLTPPLSPTRNRVHSSPVSLSTNGHNRSISMGVPQPPSVSSYRANFNIPPRPPTGLNGHPSSPFRSSFTVPLPGQINGHAHTMHGPSNTHSRTRSISSPFSPPLPSPLSSSFPAPPRTMTASISSSPPNSHPFPIPTSHSAPDSSATTDPPSPVNRRHSRLHSRNLSVFFPRAGSLPQTSIAEDGTQELELGDVRVDEEAPISTMPPAGPNLSLPNRSRASRSLNSSSPLTPLGAGFTFGTRPPSLGPTPHTVANGDSSTSSASRRGHHHKHSMSHNFFSFLEPGSTHTNGYPPDHEPNEQLELHTQPTPIPVSPWTPLPSTDSMATSSSTSTSASTIAHNGHAEYGSRAPKIEGAALVAGCVQFVLGAWLWVCGQQISSLGCTGLGYWVVFDSMGVGIKGVLLGWLEGRSAATGAGTKRFYGNARIETVMMFAQAVYLMFSSVYVCKETVEHLLLSAGGTAGGGEEGHGHHHHHHEDNLGINFPVVLTFITLLTVLGTAFFFDNHSKLVQLTNTRIPPLRNLIKSFFSFSPNQRQHELYHEPTSPFGKALSNPFVLSPIVFCAIILAIVAFVPPDQHRTYDLALAALVTVVTFNVAYKASVVLGTVLLQTAPVRSATGGNAGGRGKMEAFLRVMREVERHPQVLHLPAPHIWQLTPTPLGSSSAISSYTSSSSTPGLGSDDPLVVTLEVHVSEHLADDDVLDLTRWIWERCVGALGGAGNEKGQMLGSRAEVTVGVVRG